MSLLLGNNPKPLVSLGRLFQDARFDFPALWNDGHPAGRRLDDEGSIRGLEMAQQVHLIRFGIWKARAGTPGASTAPDGVESQAPYRAYAPFMEQLLCLREVTKTHPIPTLAAILSANEEPPRPNQTYPDVFQAALPATTDGSASRPRQAGELQTKFIAHYWACVLFCRRWLGASNSQPEAIHQHAVSRIVDCLPSVSPHHQHNKASLIRFTWPIFMAAIETTDPARRDGLLARLRETRDASAECEWSWAAARDIVGLQMRGRQGEVGGSAEVDDAAYCWVDLTQFMQSPSPAR